MIMIFDTPASNFYTFHFFEILIFQIVGRVEGQKMMQNDKKRDPSHHTSYDLHLWLHMCKRIIYKVNFFKFFQNFNFWHQ